MNSYVEVIASGGGVVKPRLLVRVQHVSLLLPAQARRPTVHLHPTLSALAANLTSAERKRPGQLLRIRPKFVDLRLFLFLWLGTARRSRWG